MPFDLSVYGVPAPQGSKRGFVRGGKAVIVEASSRTHDWRQMVVSAAREKVESDPEAFPIEGPVLVDMTFYLPRPKSYPKRIIYPYKGADLDKYIRNVNDALTNAGVWRDDAQVSDLNTRKRFATDRRPPGVDVRVDRME